MVPTWKTKNVHELFNKVNLFEVVVIFDYYSARRDELFNDVITFTVNGIL